jgi:WD40 repeat protein
MPADTARVDYRVGSEFDPDQPHGRYELTLFADGGATLRHRHRGVHRSWAARVDAVVWPRLLAALRASRFPRMPRPGTRGTIQELEVSGVEPAGGIWMRRGDGDALGLTAALRLLDSLAHQVSNGAIRGEGTLPRIVYGVTAGGGEEPTPMEVAAFGTLGLRHVGGTVRVDGTVAVVGVPDGAPVTTLPSTGAPPRAVAFGEIGTPGEPQPVIMTGGDDGVIRLWTPTGTLLARQTRHAAPVTAITTTVDDAELQVWSGDLAGGLLQRGLRPDRPVLTWPGSSTGVTALGWAGTPAYQVLVVGTEDGRIARRSLLDPAEIEVWPGHEGPVTAIDLIGADDDFLIASAGTDGAIRLRTGLAGKPEPDLPGHDSTVTGVAFGLVGERLVVGSCGLDGTVCTWDATTREPLARWPAGDDWPSGLADARTGGVQRWATGGADGVVRIWDAATGEQVLALAATEDAGAVLCVATALLPGTTLVAAGHQDGTFRVWNAVDGTLVGADRSSDEPVTSVEFGRDGRLSVFVCGTLNGSVRVHDPKTARLLRVLTPHTDQVLSLAAGTAGPKAEPVVVSGGADGTVRVWAARTGWPVLCLDRYTSGHTDLVTVVALGTVGGHAVVASGGYDRTLRLWDLDTGRPRWRMATPTSTVYALAIGDAVLVTGGLDDPVRMFMAETGALRMATARVPGLVTSVAVGEWRGAPVVVAAGAGVGVRCWTRPGGEPVPVTPPPWPVLSVTLTAAGELWAIGAAGVAVIEPAGVIDPSRADERG